MKFSVNESSFKQLNRYVDTAPLRLVRGKMTYVPLKERYGKLATTFHSLSRK